MRLSHIIKAISPEPFVDNTVYYSKILALGAVVKDKDLADSKESEASMYYADLYIQSIEGKAPYDAYEYNDLILSRCEIGREYWMGIKKDPRLIPLNKRETCRKFASEYFVNHYVEYNEYYRMIMGKPPLGMPFLYVDADLRKDNIGVDFSKPMHEMSEFELNILEDNGIMDDLRSRYIGPAYAYLNYIASGITAYAARKADNFELLYLPRIDQQVLSDKFKNRYIVNRAYTMATVYAEAYRFDSDYYTNFITIFILLQTMIDLISETGEHIIKLDVLDERCIRYIFEWHDVPYYDEIPLKYQIAMVKNLNKLLKFKSTPTCMVDICSLFGFDDIRIFKYYLLKDRKSDPDTGDYVFNYKYKTYLDTEEVMDTATSTMPITDHNNIPIPYPNNDTEFLDKGNYIHLYTDDLLIPPSEYNVIEHKIVFENEHYLDGKTTLKFDFLSNKTPDIPANINDYTIKTESKFITIVDNSTREVPIEFPVDKDTYFEKGFGLRLSVGSTFIDPTRYRFNDDFTKIIFTDDIDWNISDTNANRELIAVFIYSDKYKFKFKTIQTKAKDTSNTIITEVPEDIDYVDHGVYFADTASVYLQKDRYFSTLTSDGKLNITNIDNDDKFIKDRVVNTNFIYSNTRPVALHTETQTITVTTPGETKYELNFPFAGYIDNNNVIEVYVNGDPLAFTEYTILKNTLHINKQNLLMRKGITIEVIYTYPEDQTVTNKKVKTVAVDNNKQSVLSLEYPYDGYIPKKNKIILLVNGRRLEESRFRYTNTGIEITDTKFLLNIADNVVCYYYDYPENEFSINIEDQFITTPIEGTNKFQIIFPFFNYMKSHNGLFVTIGSTLVSPERYRISGDIFEFTDGTVIDSNRGFNITFVYNTIFRKYNKYIKSEMVMADIADDATGITIPFPFDGYLESPNNNRMMMVMDDGYVLVKNDYEIINGKIFLTDKAKMAKHGSKIKFIFNYINAKINKKLVEDNEKNYDLKFVKIPLTESGDKYIKDKNNHIPYDKMTEGDGLWTGEMDKEDVYREILDKEFNYVRTKYITIDSVMSMTKIAFDMPYFFNLLFDKVKLEDRLMLQVPSIREFKMFRLSDIMCTLFSLMYEYYNLEDDIMQDPEKIMYIMGFNFDADLGVLQKMLRGPRYYKDLDYTGADKFESYKTPLTSAKQLLKIFNNNLALRNSLLTHMKDANNYREYNAYKKTYEALMQIKYNNDFFKMPFEADRGKEPNKSYYNFLTYRDRDLSGLIDSIRNIGDLTEKRKRIINTCIDITKYVERYFNSNEYQYLFNSFPGVGLDFIKQYVAKVINFFKSYKIEVMGINTIYKFDSRLFETIRAIDDIWYICKIKDDDSIDIVDGIVNTHIKSLAKDAVHFCDKMYLRNWWYKTLILADMYDILPKDIIKYIVLKPLIDEIDGLDGVHDKLNLDIKLMLDDHINSLFIYDTMGSNVHFKVKDTARAHDHMWLNPFYKA